MFASCSTSDEVGLLKLNTFYGIFLSQCIYMYIECSYNPYILKCLQCIFKIMLYFQFHLTDDQLTRMDESVRSRPFLLPQFAFR